MAATGSGALALAVACGLALGVAGSGLAVAHEAAPSGGFGAGFLHPLGGLDHVVAMVAVGLWGAHLGAPAVWLLPVVFPLVMAFGGILGLAGVPMPAIEIGIALSAVVLGSLIAGAVRAPIWIAAIVVGAFAIFHGHAHGAELPAGAGAVAYSAGFVVATGLLHLSGIALSGLNRWRAGAWIVRAGGVAISLAGLAFLMR